MAGFGLLAKLVVYYGVLAGAVAVTLWFFPGWQEYLPIGRVEKLIADTSPALLDGKGVISATRPNSLGASVVWLATAVFGALLASLPVSWVYMKIRNPDDYDQSLIDTIVVLPLVVTSIVVVVQHSLALAFSLAGIAGVARYRNNLKSSGDLLFILLAIGIGLAAGIGAMELALVTSAAFNLCFLVLWSTNYGERAEMKRFLVEAVNGRADASADAGAGADTVMATTSTTVATEVTKMVEVRAEPAKDRPDPPS